eukprot:scaffold16953_cov79-Skeletonema_dohrnii-CCMP3373.AAC.3
MSDNDSRESAESLSDELFEHCESESLSEDGLRDIIGRHHQLLTPNNNRHVSNYKFFLVACLNERVTEGIIQCLLEYFPAAASTINDNGQLPLHFALCNQNVTLNIIQILIDAAPDTVRSVDEDGEMPLQCLCGTKVLDEAAALDILKLLIEKYPEAVRHAENDGSLPIHYAAISSKNPEFCRELIKAYPGSEHMTGTNDAAPLHYACRHNSVDTVEYLYKVYPDAINHATTDGHYPIHYAITGMNHRDSPIAAVDIVQFLLGCDPTVKLQKFRGEFLLYCACQWDYTDSNIHAGIEMVKVIYDAHPEAIEDNNITSDIHRYHEQVQTLINSQLVYARLAKNHRMMTTPDHNRQLPLHTALQNNVRLGSIKLLVKGNPSAIRNFDQSGVIPLHLACRHHDSTNVIQYLLSLDTTTLDAVDREGNTALHYACRGAKYETITMLLETYDAVSVSRRNARKKLPINLLWESNVVEDRDGIAYTESVFRLLKAYPEIVMDYNEDTKQPAAADATQNGKKRKFGK